MAGNVRHTNSKSLREIARCDLGDHVSARGDWFRSTLIRRYFEIPEALPRPELKEDIAAVLAVPQVVFHIERAGIVELDRRSAGALGLVV